MIVAFVAVVVIALLAFCWQGKKLNDNQKELDESQRKLDDAQKKLVALGYEEYAQVKAEIERGNQTIRKHNATIAALQFQIAKLTEQEIDRGNQTIRENSATIEALRSRIVELTTQKEKLERQNATASKQLAKLRELYRSVDYCIANFFDLEPPFDRCKLSTADTVDFDNFAPTVTLHLHSMDVKALNKAFRANDKQIESILTKYAKRYTTKANQAIYKLMVIALRAELQNVLYNLKYEKLDVAEKQVQAVTAKYLAIAAEGNQSIAGTLTKFIGEIEYLFLNAIKIEYNYYVKKEQAKQEQAAIREQMRQEAAERKALEAEKKKIEAEESKYQNEIARVQQQLSTASSSEMEILKRRVLELQSMLSDVLVRKDDVLKLQNGKAGTVYVISNLGSFGENVFKIGMTRRLVPQDRIDELGSASVPFNFDVHSFIFSQDAVALEGELHRKLSKCRVNKVNARKEFFYSSVDELEAMVMAVDPSAEFNRTMAAEDFRQSQSTDELYTSEQSDIVVDEDDDE